ncbi:MAG: chemotaxis protein CheC [Candidatus Altiarchaeota archaeon]|nr:chemotaxis protein CheC [Candidatus Altiarchaeota archaeon]
MTEDIGMTKLQLDALREVGTIGAGSSSVALSEMLDCEIMLRVPWVKLVGIDEVPSTLAPPRDLLVEISSLITGDINALIVMVFEREDATKLADIIISNILVRKETSVLDQISRDALSELSNILFGSYLTALSDFLDVRPCHHVPLVSFTMTERSVTDIRKGFTWEIKKALILATEFTAKETTIKGRLIFLPDSKSLKLIIEKLDKKVGE